MPDALGSAAPDATRADLFPPRNARNYLISVPFTHR